MARKKKPAKPATPEMECSWKSGARMSRLEFDTAYAELERIRKAHGNELRPAIVVEEARDKTSAIHNWFQWDDDVAAHEYRLIQARKLIHSVQVIYADRPKSPTRRYQIAQSDYAPSERVYKTTEDVLRDPDDRAALLNRAMSELLAIQRKYRALQELAIVFRAIDEVLTSIKV